MKTKLLFMIITTMVLAIQTTTNDEVIVQNQPKITHENEVIEINNESEIEEKPENVITEKQKKVATSSAPITQEVKQVISQEGAEDGLGSFKATANKNKVYVEGFGYVDDSCPADSITVDSDGDINKIVGRMD